MLHKWEIVDGRSDDAIQTWRMAVPGGWFYIFLIDGYYTDPKFVRNPIRGTSRAPLDLPRKNRNTRRLGGIISSPDDKFPPTTSP